MSKSTVKLSDIAAVFNGKTPSTNEQRNTGHPVLKIKDVTELGQFTGRFESFIDLGLAAGLRDKQLEDGDTLILNAAHHADYVGSKTYFADRAVRGAVPTGEWLVVRGHDANVRKRYLFYWLNSTPIRRQIRQLVKGIHLYPTDVEELEFVVPTLEKQDQIVDALDNVGCLLKLRRTATEATEKLSIAIFLKMFGDPLKNPHGWTSHKLGSLGELDRGRSRNRPRNAPELYGGPYPFIQTGDIANSGGYIRGYQQTYSEKGLAQSKLWPEGTLCITIAANIGKTAILTFPACFPDSVVGFSPNKKTTTEFIQFWLQMMQKEIERNAPESAQKNINLEILRELDVALPPIGLQKKFAVTVGEIEKMRMQNLESERQVEELFDSLMDKIFDKDDLTQNTKPIARAAVITPV